MKNLDNINKEYINEFDKDLEKDKDTLKKKGIDIENLNVDSFCMNFSSDELESLKDVFYRDRQNKLKKNFWMYESEHNANQKLKQIKDYSDKYLAIEGDVILNILIFL
jgi:hypothetical protein